MPKSEAPSTKKSLSVPKRASSETSQESVIASSYRFKRLLVTVQPCGQYCRNTMGRDDQSRPAP